MKIHYQGNPILFLTNSEGEPVENNFCPTEISDGYHSYEELYTFRMLLNASLFNEWAKSNLYDCHKSKRHSDGEPCFGTGDYFIVVAQLPTGQISFHYPFKDWNNFKIPERGQAETWDGHDSEDVALRLEAYLLL